MAQTCTFTPKILDSATPASSIMAKVRPNGSSRSSETCANICAGASRRWWRRRSTSHRRRPTSRTTSRLWRRSCSAAARRSLPMRSRPSCRRFAQRPGGIMMTEPIIHPFPGLRPFEADEEHLFFGREGQSEEILRGLRRHRFLAVVGSSGSGKSSLIRAGLLPYLHGGFLTEDASHWRVAIFRPGANPIGNLAAALNDPSVLGNPPRGVEAAREASMLLEVSLRRSGVGLIDVIRLARLPERDQVLVVIDQFEELFRFANTTDK